MRILHIIISKGWHAQVANAHLIMQHQAESGDIVDVCCMKNSKIHRKMQGSANILKTFKHYYNPILVPILIRLLVKHSYNAIHLHGYNGKSRLGLSLKISEKNIPVICSSRDMPKEGILFRKFFWKHIHRILVPNQLVKNGLEQSVGRKKSIKILEPQVNTDLLRPLPGKYNKILKIGMFARFDAIKGYPIFFAACQKLLTMYPVNKIELVIAGANFKNHQQEIQTLLKQFDLTHATQMIGYVPDIGVEISKLDIGVIASTGSEELSRIAMEYMACGVPVVSTDVGGLPELISDQEGTVVPAFSPEKLAQAISDLVDNEPLRLAKGRQARQKMEKVHAITVHCNNLKNIISAVSKELIAAPPS